jgi:hypothetical protein
MDVTIRRIEELTIVLGPGDKRYYVTSPFSPSFHMYPDKVIARLDRGIPGVRASVIGAEATGQRLRLMASGEVKKVGPGRGMRADQPTTWEFRSHDSISRGLLDLVCDGWILR